MDLESRLLAAQGESLAANMRRWLAFVDARPGDVIELQALEVPARRGPVESRFAHATSSGQAIHLLTQAEAWQPHAPAIYQIINRLDPRVGGRAEPGKWHRAGRGGTSDRDVAARMVLPIDVDVERPHGISTDAVELARSVDVADAVHAHLARLVPIESIAYGHSGNGRWLALALDAVPADVATKTIVKDILDALNRLHGRPGEVKIDPAVCDAKRLGPAWGTTKRKGVPTDERPHRRTAVVTPTTVHRIASDELFALRNALAREAGLEARTSSTTRANAKPKTHASKKKPVDPAWTAANEVPVEDVVARFDMPLDGGSPRCPGCDRGGKITSTDSGKALKCFSATCESAGKSWWTPVDLVAAVRGVEPVEALRLICDEFGLEGPKRRDKKKFTPKGVDGMAPSFATALTDLGNAERLVRDHGADIRWVAAWKRWIVWDGRRWSVDETGQVERYAMQTVRGLYEEAAASNDPDRVQELVLWAVKSESARAIRDMMTLARSMKGISVTADDLDSHHWLLNVLNGTIDLRSGDLRAPRREDLLTNIAPVRFEPESECPTWLAFLDRIFAGNAELIRFAQRIIGLCLTGDVSVQKLFILYGEGANGKSTFLTTIQEMLGPYSLQAAPELLLRKGDGQSNHPTEVAALRGRRMAVCTEVDGGRGFAEATVKRLTGGDRVTARFCMKDFFEFSPTHKLLLACNDKPTVRGNDEGIWRRLCLLPFAVTIPESERDDRLKEKLANERSGVLRWALEGTRAWQTEGLREPLAVVEETARYRSDEDLLAGFFGDRCVFVPHASAFAHELRSAYATWCASREERPVGTRTFARYLRSRGASNKSSTNGKIRWIGVGLLDSSEVSERDERDLSRSLNAYGARASDRGHSLSLVHSVDPADFDDEQPTERRF